jgi:signal peptidase I
MISTAVEKAINSRLEAGNTINFHVCTSSMAPTLLPGDVLVLQGREIGRIVRGSVIILFNGENWIAHRLLDLRAGLEKRSLVTKGDNSNHIDPGWCDSRVQGCVVGIHREGRFIDLLSWRARLGGYWIAGLSRLQAHFYELQSGFSNRIILFVLRGLIRYSIISVYGR